MMRFVCDWHAVAMPESEALLDAEVILDAASRAVPVWEDDVDLSDDEGPSNDQPHWWTDRPRGT
jgi:hypothetical protein